MSLAGATPAPHDARSALPRGRGQRVLVVEDEPRVRALVRRILGWLGYEVLEASGAAEALTVLDGRADVDLVFSDIVLPGGLSGCDLADVLATRRPGLPVLLTTGYAQARAPRRAGGRVPVLPKPWSLAALAASVHDALAGAR